MPKITEMFAYTMIDENGDEGIIAFLMDNNLWMPLCGADMERVKALKPYADKISEFKGRPYQLLKFKLVERL